MIKEDWKRHMQLLEYNFYGPKDMGKLDKKANKIIDEDDPEAELDDEGNAGEEEMPADDEAEGGDEEETFDTQAGDEEETFDTQAGGEEEVAPEDEESGGIEDVGGAEEDEDVEEIDVTELVRNSEETQEKAEQATEKVSQLFNKFDELEDKLSKMDQISHRIDNLEQEIETRNPTPKEKLEMRSFDSYPYNLKLTDFWNEKTEYEATDDDSEMEEEENGEYVLTVSDVEDDYSEEEIKRDLENDDNGFPFNI